MPERSVHTVVSSPPYWGLRDYGTGRWVGGDEGCDHSEFRGGNGAASSKQVTSVGTQRYQQRGTCKDCGAVRTDGQLGLEPTPEQYVETMVDVFRQVRRVLRDDGTVWLNLGDSYTSGNRSRYAVGSDLANSPLQRSSGHWSSSDGQHRPDMPEGLKPKDLVGIPWMVAFALRADGWYLRSDIIWSKPNPMPESVTDRPTKAHEYLFLLSKSKSYYYDADAIREPASENVPWAASSNGGTKIAVHRNDGGAANLGKPAKQDGHGRRHAGFNGRWDEAEANGTSPEGRNKRSVWEIATQPFKEAHFATFPEALVKPCILAGSPPDGTVLDPFGGSGTVGVVARKAGRRAVLIELNEDYCAMMRDRMGQTVML